MKYYYHVSYDEKKDSFWSYVDSGTKESKAIFQIHNTEEMVGLIQDGIMDHLDDVDGLEDHLKQEGLINDEDDLLISEVLW